MKASHDDALRPGYDTFRSMDEMRGPFAEAFAKQILATTAGFRTTQTRDLDVLDIGCGYGQTALELAKRCASVVGIEPSEELYEGAKAHMATSGLTNIEFRLQGIRDLDEDESFDLVVLDNVYEHLPQQQEALAKITTCLRPGGALFLLTPNRLWPIEAHYRLPFLSYLPLRLANAYLRASHRGSDYTDASYSPTWWSLKRSLEGCQELDWQAVLPADRSATMSGSPIHYRGGMRLLSIFPSLWAFSKAFLIIAVKG